MKNILLCQIVFVLIVISGCDNSITDKALIKEAEICMKGAMDEGGIWLNNFNEIGFPILLDHQFPSPFDKIIFESLHKIEAQKFDKILLDSLQRIEAQNWIEIWEQKYGIIKEREFVGIHIITKGKLLTYVPGTMNGFKQISPKRLGLNRVRQLYIKNVEGTYAYLMYNSRPTKKEHAEELIILWQDQNNKWSFLSYKIDDDI